MLTADNFWKGPMVTINSIFSTVTMKTKWTNEKWNGTTANPNMSISKEDKKHAILIFV